ncbi:MAG: MBL fold metallo-hydrolase [Bacteroidetes bacterium]|nr:MAG: MBL fold metallo-hydrolase [Bacteroidota bacterium]
MSKYRVVLILAIFLAVSQILFGQANGNLQLHYVDVGQGDMEVLISPQGQVVLFDEGANKNCEKPLAYLQSLNIQKIDYIITSHYHEDHIGYVGDILRLYPLQSNAYDRGYSYNNDSYGNYIAAVGKNRTEATLGTQIILDQNFANPVSIKIVTLNGNGINAENENDLSITALVTFGNFQAELGGDLSGKNSGQYKDIESSVATKVGQIEVYKVHHHGSKCSSNDKWLSITKPKVGIISVGDGNKYKHPTKECLDRLHKSRVKTYWTEKGNGVLPDKENDIVDNGSIVVEVEPGSNNFTVKTNNRIETYTDWENTSTGTTSGTVENPKFSWSKESDIYHYSDCKRVRKINSEFLKTGTTRPSGKKLHKGCPEK